MSRALQKIPLAAAASPCSKQTVFLHLFTWGPLHLSRSQDFGAHSIVSVTSLPSLSSKWCLLLWYQSDPMQGITHAFFVVQQTTSGILEESCSHFHCIFLPYMAAWALTYWCLNASNWIYQWKEYLHYWYTFNILWCTTLVMFFSHVHSLRKSI